MGDMDHIETNRAMWDARVSAHVRSDFYATRKVREGGLALDDIEMEALGDVRGLSILHLQCHFGLSTVSMARLGARATGVDFSEKAIDAAMELADELRVDARFIHSSVEGLRDVDDSAYDIVFASYGVLCWIGDLDAWARSAFESLRPGGRLIIIDTHPFGNVFDMEHDSPRLGWDYFDETKQEFMLQTTYTGDLLDKPMRSYDWHHTLSSIVNALINAGLALTRMEEHPVNAWKQYPFLVEKNKGSWGMPDDQPNIPLVLALFAVRP